MNRVLTSSLPYVNAPPHLGHALELALVDALARFRRGEGEALILASGTDDHSLKNVRAAEAAGCPVAAYVRENGERFRALSSVLGVAFDAFVETGSDPEHVRVVQELWRRCNARGDLYRSRYRGLYCVGCEAFYAESDLDDGTCPEHGTAPEVVEEKNWFFRLSRHAERLQRAIESDAIWIRPVERKREVLSFVRSGLRDFSVSRSIERARGWGVPVPDDPSQIVFVWFDALAGYLSSLGPLERWENATGRSHLIGKGITRFHAVYWPAILWSAELPAPNEILVHGYVTVEGKKIGKSVGNAIDPHWLLERHGVDALRWFLLRHLHTTKDSDFSLERFDAVYESELADQIGNLVSRVVALIERHTGGLVPPSHGSEGADTRLLQAVERSRVETERGFRDFALHDAAAAVLDLASAANRHLDETAPWHLAKDLGARERLETVLHHAVAALRVLSELLAPFVPATSIRIAQRIGGPRVKSGPQLFPKSALPARR